MKYTMKERYELVKTHFRLNYKPYLIGVGGAAAGGLGVFLLMREGDVIDIDTTVEGDDNNVITNEGHLKIFESFNNITQVILPALGDPGNVVQCVETNMFYASQGQLAREVGVSATVVANHLHDNNVPHINGKHYKVIGKAGHPIAV